MPVLYTTIFRGEQVDLETLTAEQRQLLKECFDLYLANHPWPDFCSNLYKPENMRIAGHELSHFGKYMITARSANSAIRKVLKDIETMLGVRQGFILDEGLDFSAQEEALKDFLK